MPSDKHNSQDCKDYRPDFFFTAAVKCDFMPTGTFWHIALCKMYTSWTYAQGTFVSHHFALMVPDDKSQ